MSLFAEIREACARVRAEARHVHVDAAAFDRWVADEATRPPEPSLDPAHDRFERDETTLAFVFTMNAINFGSGWFPSLRKRDGLSGYRSLATRLRERFEERGGWTTSELRGLTADDCTRVFEQEGVPEVAPLMALFAQALSDLGGWLEARHGGSFEAAALAAGGRAENLVRALAEMPLYQDVSRYEGFAVPLYKRAQITASDLAAVFAEAGPGAFDDLAELTIFADNLVPHVLRCSGVLVYEDDLARRIDREEVLETGSAEEVEIRAIALDVVEKGVAALRQRGVRTSARQLDTALWNRGQRPEIKAHPRHRARCAYY